MDGITRLRKAGFYFLILIFILGMGTGHIMAEDTQDGEKKKKKERSWTAVPMITSNPAMGTAFGAMGLYFFNPQKNDTVSPPSLLAFYGVYSVNDSYVFALPMRMHLNEDKWRITAFVATTRVNNDFDYEVGDQDINLVFSELRNIYGLTVSRAFFKHVYFGIAYTGVSTKYRFDKGTDEQNDFARELFEQYGITDKFVSSLGLDLSLDSRDYPYYPSRGINLQVTPKFFTEWLGGDNTYTNLSYGVDYYATLSDTLVLAARLGGGSSFGDVPFSGYQSYGGRNQRGYPQGKYRGKHTAAL